MDLKHLVVFDKYYLKIILRRLDYFEFTLRRNVLQFLVDKSGVYRSDSVYVSLRASDVVLTVLCYVYMAPFYRVVSQRKVKVTANSDILFIWNVIIVSSLMRGHQDWT